LADPAVRSRLVEIGAEIFPRERQTPEALSALDTRKYQKGIKVTNAEMKSLNITGHLFHPEWNYTIRPRHPSKT